MTATIRFEKSEALLRHLIRVAEEEEGIEAQAILPYGEKRVAVRVEILPKEATEAAATPSEEAQP